MNIRVTYAISVLLALPSIVACSALAQIYGCPWINETTFTGLLRIDDSDTRDGFDHTVVFGPEVAVVTRHKYKYSWTGYLFGDKEFDKTFLVGAYYCGKYYLANPEGDPVTFKVIPPIVGDTLTEEIQSQYRELLQSLTEDSILMDGPITKEPVTLALKHSVRFPALERHRELQRQVFPRLFVSSNNSNLDFRCGDARFTRLFHGELIADQGLAVFQDKRSLMALCHVLPDVLEIIVHGGYHDLLNADDGAEVNRYGRVTCPGLRRVKAQTDRGRFAKKFGRVRQSFVGTAKQRQFLSFAHLCADEHGVPSWLSGLQPSTSVVQPYVDSDWVRAVLQVANRGTNRAHVQTPRESQRASVNKGIFEFLRLK